MTLEDFKVAQENAAKVRAAFPVRFCEVRSHPTTPTLVLMRRGSCAFQTYSFKEAIAVKRVWSMAERRKRKVTA